ncbi:4Fe-4S binding protein [Noviherbaspirillum sp. 17J57-3]|uniref:4Fe-4S binding protein n=2 Tax=Noviherbaspirillum galbum TaxID=2709383 RepID=A0A6B3SYM9_9BURK|nr:4Fe-4S binding protein [Noviherbaspirillum galbum]
MAMEFIVTFLLLSGLSLLMAGREARAGVMTRDAMARAFPSPYLLGERDPALPVWPVFKQNATSNDLVGYAFESIDFVAIPGFAGVPVNMLVLLGPSGEFVDVRVISHHEPVFLDGLGEAPLHRFAAQYRGLSLRQNIAIDAAPRNRAGNDAGNVHIDGVAKATASVRIINQSVIAAALKVARARLGFSGGSDPDRIARVRQNYLERLRPEELQAAGLLSRLQLDNAAVERAFAGSEAEGIDQEAVSQPSSSFIDLAVTPLSVPSAAQSLLTPRDQERLKGRLEPGDHALLVSWRGRYGIVSDSFVPGTVSDRLVLSQGGLPMEMRDLNFDLKPPADSPLQGRQFKIFRVIAQSGLDPALPMQFAFKVQRFKGQIYPEKFTRDFSFSLALPARFVVKPEPDNKGWLPIWKQRWMEIALAVAALALLFAALLRWRGLVADGRRFGRIRTGFLGFTLVFIGWFAQGQLSIVNLTGLVQALHEKRDLSYLMYDPMSIVLWGGVLVSLFIWGRGTFCGWLCPFGAMQEFVAKAARLLRVPQWRVGRRTDQALRGLKYIALAGILACAWWSPAWTDRLVELEPFKTAITLNFVRAWPYVLYAAGLLALNALVYKAFCRYLCPFGAGLAVLGRVRLWNWLPRRKECGTPCQTCRHRCDYGAIRKDGAIRYDECFQCMDCVVIHQSDDLCAPLLLEKKRRVIPVRAA